MSNLLTGTVGCPKLLPQAWKHTVVSNVFVCCCIKAESKGPSPNMFQHENAPVHKAGAMKRLAKIGVEVSKEY